MSYFCFTHIVVGKIVKQITFTCRIGKYNKAKIQNQEKLKSLLHSELENINKTLHLKSVCQYDEITEFILERYHISLDIESCSKYIENNMHFQNVIGVPLDQKRFTYCEKSIYEYYSQLEKIVPRVNPCLIYKLNEFGYQDYVDSLTVTVVVPEEYVVQKFSLPADGNAKRYSTLVAIALDGEKVKPTLILPRVTIDSEVFNFLRHHNFNNFTQKRFYSSSYLPKMV